MTVDIANRRIETFETRLGIPHLYLAYHAAFPLALTPDLLYRLWATFQKNVQGKPLNIPWIAVSNLLLSGLCREIDDELYEMDATFRSELLNRLRRDSQFGSRRIDQLSEFLVEYTAQQLRLDSTNPDVQEFAKTQRLAALAYINPDEAARELATIYRDIVLSASSSTSRKRTELMQMAALVEASTESLKDKRFEALRAYAIGMASFARGDLDNAADQLNPSIEEKGQIRVSNVILPIPEQIKAKQPAFRPPRPELTPQEYRNRQVLISKVQSFWIEGVLEKSLHNRALITLGLEERPEAVDYPQELVWDISNQTRRTLPAGTRIIERLDALGSGRRLLILGEPGSGKTTTLLELARDLSVRAEQDVEQPVPVVLNLSSWANRRQSIERWIVEELYAKYQVPRSTGEAWVKDERLLLLLDGLDEVRLDHREACLEAINRFSQEYEPEIVVCSRIRDYEVLSSRLSFHGAILLQPLTPKQVYKYLANAGEDLAELRRLFLQDESLQDLTKSALMLNIIILIFQGGASEDLPKMKSVELRKHIFNFYIEYMLKRQNIKQKYPKRHVIKWLNWLAVNMTRMTQTIFLIEQIQPEFLANRSQYFLYKIGISQIIGSLISLVPFCLLALFNDDFNGYSFVLLRILFSIEIIATLFSLFYEAIARFSYKFIHQPFAHLVNGFVGSWIFGWIFIFTMQLVFPNLLTGLEVGEVILSSSLSLFLFFILYPLSKTIYDGRIHTVEILKWSWLQARKKIFFGFLAGGMVGLIMSLIGNTMISVSVESTIFTIFFGMNFGLFYGIINGFQKATEVESIFFPNQRIFKTFFNVISTGILGGVLSLIIAFLGSTSYIFVEFIISDHTLSFIEFIISGFSSRFDYFTDPMMIFRSAIGVGFSGLILSGLFGGQGSGIVCIQHFILRLILWRSGYIPWNYSRFLNYTVDRGLLQKVGGGYIFIHRLLLEHFAQLPQGPSPTR